MVRPKHPINDKGKLRVRFTYGGVRFTLGNLGDYNDKIAFLHAQSICDRIALDIASGNFEPTNNGELALRYHPTSIGAELRKSGLKKEIVNQRTDNRRKIMRQLEERLEERYHSTDKSLLKILGETKCKLTTEEDAEEFIAWLKKERNLKNSTVQRYLNTLKTCSELFKNIKIKQNKSQIIKPFTKEEVDKILNWFVNTEYYDYVWFALHTGMRPSEIIGLQWDKIDFVRKEVVINSVLARDGDKTSKRKRKLPKADVVRKFPMNDTLYNFLQQRKEKNVNNYELVFASPTGKCIDDHNFVNRWWRKCLVEVGIEHIDFYNCRRTFISHYLEKTKDVVMCASLTHGTKSGIRTIWEHYAGVVNKVEVPELF